MRALTKLRSVTGRESMQAKTSKKLVELERNCAERGELYVLSWVSRVKLFATARIKLSTSLSMLALEANAIELK